jgi:alpha-1,6-mannosyltransferase
LTIFIATTALSLLLPRTIPVKAYLTRLRLAVFLLTLTAIVFRSEIAILLFCHVSYVVLKQVARYGHLTHGVALLKSSVIPAGLFGTLIGLCMTVPIDTYFWQSTHYMWPELSAFLSNVFPTKDDIGASAWGTQSWHWYFTSALPRLLMRPFIYLALWLFAVSASAISEPVLDLLFPNLAYIAIYSILPHKETRFIFPVIPSLTLAAALPASYIWIRRHRTLMYRLSSIVLVLSTLLSALIANIVILPLSALSYPGAHALNALHDHVSSVRSLGAITNDTISTIRVHLDNLSTQTGITRFLQQPCPFGIVPGCWVYDKSENTTNLLDSFWWTQFDYTIMESPQLAIGSWDIVSTTRGMGSIRILHPDEKRESSGHIMEQEMSESSYGGLDEMAFQMYGPAGRWVSVAARHILREGHGTQWLLGRNWSWTRGWWVDIGFVPKLYVLKQNESLAKAALDQFSSDAELESLQVEYAARHKA